MKEKKNQNERWSAFIMEARCIFKGKTCPKEKLQNGQNNESSVGFNRFLETISSKQ